MTTQTQSHPADAYEKTGPLTVCPKCGVSLAAGYAYACDRCYDKHRDSFARIMTRLSIEACRAWFHARGVEERAKKGEKPETWGIWYEGALVKAWHRESDGSEAWTREEAEERAKRLGARHIVALHRPGDPTPPYRWGLYRMTAPNAGFWAVRGASSQEALAAETARLIRDMGVDPKYLIAAQHLPNDSGPPQEIKSWEEPQAAPTSPQRQAIKTISPEDTIPRMSAHALARFLFETDERVVKIIHERFDLKPETEIAQAQFDIAWQNENKLRKEWLAKARAVERRVVEKGKKP